MPTDLPSHSPDTRCWWRRPCVGLGPSAPLRPALAALLCLAGCIAVQPPLQPLAPASHGSSAAPGQPGEPLLEPRYLRFKAEDTGLSAVQDDGRYMYLEFSSAVESDVEIFDQDGRGLETASAGRVLAVRGIRPGILVRRHSQVSFVSLNPRAVAAARPPLAETAAHAEVRARLDNHDGQLHAMQRALEAARAAMASAGARDAAARAGPSTHPAGAGSSSMQPAVSPHEGSRAAALQGRSSPAQEPAARASDASLPEVVYASSSPPAPRLQASAWSTDPTPRRIFAPPLAAANASASAPERGLVRIFFATASRAIVAPEDGLALLLREAANADEIRVTGFTDATGSRVTNDVLAQARADAVVQILMRRGIPASRIFSSAVGAAEYIADNASEHGRALNRRVEVLLLRNGAPVHLAGPPRAMP